MIKKCFHKILSIFDTRSEYEKQEDEKMMEAIRNAPESMRVVGRGTVVVDPKDIVNSKKFQEEKIKARALVKKLSLNDMIDMTENDLRYFREKYNRALSHNDGSEKKYEKQVKLMEEVLEIYKKNRGNQ